MLEVIRVKDERNKKFKSRPRCYYCNTIVIKTQEEVPNQATADHVYSKWNILRHTIPEDQQPIVLSCRKCNQERALVDKAKAYEQYPKLREMREAGLIDLKRFYESMNKDLYKEGNMWVGGGDIKPLLSCKILDLSGKPRKWIEHKFYTKVKMAKTIRLNNTLDHLENNIMNELFIKVGKNVLLKSKEDFIFIYSMGNLIYYNVIISNGSSKGKKYFLLEMYVMDTTCNICGKVGELRIEVDVEDLSVYVSSPPNMEDWSEIYEWDEEQEIEDISAILDLFIEILGLISVKEEETLSKKEIMIMYNSYIKEYVIQGY